jgi:hypothetical protein
MTTFGLVTLMYDAPLKGKLEIEKESEQFTWKFYLAI